MTDSSTENKTNLTQRRKEKTKTVYPQITPIKKISDKRKKALVNYPEGITGL